MIPWLMYLLFDETEDFSRFKSYEIRICGDILESDDKGYEIALYVGDK